MLVRSRSSVLSAAFGGFALAALVQASPTLAADAEKGKQVFESKCADCHEAADLTGDAAKDFSAKVLEIAAGKIKHKKKVKMSKVEADDVSAWAATLK